MSDFTDAKIQNIEECDISFSNWSFSNDMKEIIKTMTGLTATEEKVTQDMLKEFNEQVSGVIMLIGSKKIMFSVSMSKITAVNLVAAMTGSDTEEIKHIDIIDGAAELANIVGGKMKAKFAAAGEKYSPLLPYTIVGDNHYIVHKNRIAIHIRKYKAENVELLVRIFSL